MTDKEKILAEIKRKQKEEYICDSWEEQVGYFGALDALEDFINSLPEEPVSEDLDEAAKGYATEGDEISGLFVIKEEVFAFEAGAKWQKEQFEKERLAHCDTLTKEEYEIESEFVISHLKKNNRTPTFIDAIEYGYRKAIEDACEWIKQQQDLLEDCFSDAGDFADLLKEAME